MAKKTTDLQRLKALLEMAERGVGGEAVNAREALDRLMKRTGITIEQLIDNKPITRQYRYSDDYDRRLIIQIRAAVVKNRDTSGHYTYSYPNRQRTRNLKMIGYEVTAAEHADIELMLRYYRQAWKEEVRKTFDAFIQRHRLFNPEIKGTTTLSDEDLADLIARMAVMKSVKVRKELTGGR